MCTIHSKLFAENIIIGLMRLMTFRYFRLSSVKDRYPEFRISSVYVAQNEWSQFFLCYLNSSIKSLYIVQKVLSQ